LLLPPPVDRQVNVGFAQSWQNVDGSMVPASTSAASDAGSHARKQYVWPEDSNDAQVSLNPAGHSPGTLQQSASEVQVCVQYPFRNWVRHVTCPCNAAASSPT
jgi:hypothetical protein